MTNLKLASLNGGDRTVVPVDSVKIGLGFTVIAGPCTVESEEQTVETAIAVKKAGAHALRSVSVKDSGMPPSACKKVREPRSQIQAVGGQVIRDQDEMIEPPPVRAADILDNRVDRAADGDHAARTRSGRSCTGADIRCSAILEPTAVRTILTYLGFPDKPPGLAPARIPEQSQFA